MTRRYVKMVAQMFGITLVAGLIARAQVVQPGAEAHAQVHGNEGGRGVESRPTDDPISDVATVAEIMTQFIDPAADAIWASVGSSVTRAGTEERAPQGADEWLGVRRHALMLAESANLLVVGHRAQRGGEWTIRAQALRNAALRVIAATEARSADDLLAAGEQVTIACDQCHQRFWDETGESR